MIIIISFRIQPINRAKVLHIQGLDEEQDYSVYFGEVH